MANDANSAPKIVFGAMTFGKEGCAEQARVHNLEDCAKILDVFQRFGHTEIDVARTYAGGSSEEYLGLLKWQDRGLVVDTKVSPKAPAAPTARRYTHTPEDLRRALKDSLTALKTDKVDMWYLHAPDHNNPYEETLREVNNLYKEGYFGRFGISNYSAWETAQICEICIRHGWKKPDAYQGVYNALHRAVEPELFPCLRYYGISFYEYNPVAGGFLTDRYQRDTCEHEAGSRFDPTRTQGAHYRRRYWNDTYFDALDVVRPVAAKLGISTAEAALRWVRHHSQLQSEHGDAIIIGASSADQLENNLTSLEKGPLPEEMVRAFDEGWAIVKAVTKPYFS
ncbi:keto reductase [Coniochaeta sp. PMI_546]|nr:keto reductase [Coniochaeta sp. PMI_546]